jgi:hypothetical protein
MTNRSMEVERAENVPPVFVSIRTSAYSGATLLSFLLGAHPQIATVGEMNGLIAREDPEVYLCSCGQKIRECDFWKSVGIAMRDRGFEFDVAHFDTQFILGGPQFIRLLRTGSFRNNTLDSMRDAMFQAWPGERRQLKALVARNEAFVEAVLAVTGKRVFVDTSKDRLRLSALRRFSRFDIRAVHLIRDVRGVVASRLRRGVGIDAREAARQWVKLHQRLQGTLAALPEGKHIRVRYEDLCQDVQGTLERLYRFCGVDSDARVADFRVAPHHIIGNPMRLVSRSEIRLDERWRSLLTEDQLKEIHREAGMLNRQYGYH